MSSPRNNKRGKKNSRRPKSEGDLFGKKTISSGGSVEGRGVLPDAVDVEEGGGSGNKGQILIDPPASPRSQPHEDSAHEQRNHRGGSTSSRSLRKQSLKKHTGGGGSSSTRRRKSGRMKKESDLNDSDEPSNLDISKNDEFTAPFSTPITSTADATDSFSPPPPQREDTEPEQYLKGQSCPSPSAEGRMEHQTLILPQQSNEQHNNNSSTARLRKVFFSIIFSNNNSKGGTSPKKDQIIDEYKLFYDTFTFLMAGRYPFEHYRGCTDKNKGQPEENEEGKEQQQQKSLVNAATAFISKEGSAEEEETEALDEDLEILASKECGSQHEQKVAKKRLETAHSDFLCLPFWVGLFINISQLFIYTIVIANVFSKSKMPPNADSWLRLAQIFAVSVTLYTQSDFIDGIFLFTERWKPFKGITTPLKFNFSAILRIISGIIGIISTFILVVYSTEVVDMLLTFTAMEFVAMLDGSAFELASKGFLGATLEKKCLEIQEFRYQRRIRHGSLTRPLAYGLCVILVFTAFIVVVSLQSRRLVGLENEIYVQLDDTDVPDLYGISGVYVGCDGFRTKETGDIGYVDIGIGSDRMGSKCPKLTRNKDKKLEIPGRAFVYCWDTNGWVYTTKITTDPCKGENHLLRSILDGPPLDSNSFDMLTHARATWVVNQRSDTGGETLLDFVFIESVGSFRNTFTQCNGKGLVWRL